MSRGPRWSAAEDAVLVRLADRPIAEIGAAVRRASGLSRSDGACNSRMCVLGIERPGRGLAYSPEEDAIIRANVGLPSREIAALIAKALGIERKSNSVWARRREICGPMRAFGPQGLAQDAPPLADFRTGERQRWRRGDDRFVRRLLEAQLDQVRAHG
jgi:hypothetical protein